MTQVTTAAPAAPVKRTRKKSAAAMQEMPVATGALAPEVNINDVFGIKDVYNGMGPEQYHQFIRTLTTADLHEHAIKVGQTPMDPKDKLFSALEKRYREAKARAFPSRAVQVKVNPEMAEFHRKFMQGEWKG